ncbi:carboxymuconolactone decarboxylase family protein [Sediminibacillus halophilus]|uniref:Alkylhydroperoxidase family enzyme, contains CxxC motif n=1 Tax=Sediminibacillus halophilus TaxID=482461 RepID=A0A1G9PBD0_9BACI|nr:carboxymuconolactone decarboxylase family protein [Sediminibacillus halophilus]SDL96182.1 Alkylhydroperoxidase family enzyme, contains CxxC motif [Sediminibacillus halophilus]
MVRINQSKTGETPFQQLLGHNPRIMKSWTLLGEALEKDGQLSKELKEQVRRTLAQRNGCQYCKAKGKPDPNMVDDRVLTATGFAEVFAKSHGEIPDSVFNVLRDVFSEKEISELIAFICFTTAQQRFGAVLQLEAEA